MSTFRAVPRYPEAQQKPLSPSPKFEVMRPTEFADWLEDGQVDVKGTIEQPCPRLGFAYVAPEGFPNQRLYFSYEESGWSNNMKKLTLKGRPCVFDVPEQAWKQFEYGVALKVRLS